MSDIFIVPSFMDLKLKSSGRGGFSDGGVLNESAVLKEAGGNLLVVEIAPPPGEAYAGINPFIQDNDLPGSVSVTNFDPTDTAPVTEYFVEEDGTQAIVFPALVPVLDIISVGAFFSNGGVLQYPNKLRYVVEEGKGPIPNGRLLLKYTVMRFDRPFDQVLE